MQREEYDKNSSNEVKLLDSECDKSGMYSKQASADNKNKNSAACL
jgi:hypothetical protein